MHPASLFCAIHSANTLCNHLPPPVVSRSYPQMQTQFMHLPLWPTRRWLTHWDWSSCQRYTDSLEQHCKHILCISLLFLSRLQKMLDSAWDKKYSFLSSVLNRNVISDYWRPKKPFLNKSIIKKRKIRRDRELASLLKKTASTFIECPYFRRQFLWVWENIHRETKLSSIQSVVVLRSLQKWDSGALHSEMGTDSDLK